MICLGGGLTSGCRVVVVVPASFVVLLVAIVTDVGEEVLLAVDEAVAESVRFRSLCSPVFGGAVLATGGGPVTRSSSRVGCLSAILSTTTGRFSSVAVASGAG